jgi:nucleoside 2-deoxyribosyltransferase
MKIYFAGPDVFRPDAAAWADSVRELCLQHGFEALTPLDHLETTPAAICNGNLELIRKAQIVVANLNPFRGAEPDSGTAFELGYALALGKKLVGYIDSLETVLERVKRLDRHKSTQTGAPCDDQGLVIENFGLPVNLMLAMSAQIVEGDLATCLTTIRPKRTENASAPKHTELETACQPSV